MIRSTRRVRAFEQLAQKRLDQLVKIADGTTGAEVGSSDVDDDAKNPEVYSELLALVVHDLRNPLSALRSNLGYLASVCQDPDARDAVEDSAVSCDGLAQILDNMDVLIHVLNGSPPLPVAPLLLGRVLEEVTEQNQSFAKSYGVSLTLQASSKERGTRVSGHREMLSRALSNLVRNAIQHASDTPVEVTLRSARGRCGILVSDGGAPLNPDLRQSVFTARGQVASKQAPNSRYSRGLGLFCAHAAALASGASVDVTPGADGRGNVFELSVPLA